MSNENIERFLEPITYCKDPIPGGIKVLGELVAYILENKSRSMRIVADELGVRYPILKERARKAHLLLGLEGVGCITLHIAYSEFLETELELVT